MGIKEAARKMMSHKEYEANMAGLNIVFGAMIGVVMGRVEDMAAFDYSLLLVLVASFVITLLYISASKQRIFYALTAAAILFLGWTNTSELELGLEIDRNLFEQRLLPVATVWFLFVCVIEFLPRGRPED